LSLPEKYTKLHIFHFRDPRASYVQFQTELELTWHQNISVSTDFKDYFRGRGHSTYCCMEGEGRYKPSSPSLPKELENGCQDLLLIPSTDSAQRWLTFSAYFTPHIQMTKSEPSAILIYHLYRSSCLWRSQDAVVSLQSSSHFPQPIQGLCM